MIIFFTDVDKKLEGKKYFTLKINPHMHAKEKDFSMKINHKGDFVIQADSSG